MTSRIQPAQLSYLAIYNPSLGPTDETFPQQLLFYYSRPLHEARLAAKRTALAHSVGADAVKRTEHEALRRIGLAQGMVDFAATFSDGRPVEAVETDRSREVLVEVEAGWWVLASVDLTVLPVTGAAATTGGGRETGDTRKKREVEYSSREVSPAALLSAQLRQAHHVFVLHHGPSLKELWGKLARDKFCGVLERFWTRFARTWDVLLHGHPAADVFGALKLASGGELGFGVGEEEWGSGEREVLEDLIHRTEGMVDAVVSRFGEPEPPEGTDKALIPEHEALPWLGSGNHPLATDGVIFSGLGNVTRPSLRNISLWMRQIYTYGEYAYGVKDNPSRERRRRRREIKPTNGEVNPKSLRMKVQKNEAAKKVDRPTSERVASEHSLEQTVDTDQLPTIPVGIPPPIVTAAEQSLSDATRKADQHSKSGEGEGEEGPGSTMGIPDQYMKYLTLGLSTWGKSSKRPSAPSRNPSSISKTSKDPESKISRPKVDDSDLQEPTMNHVEPIPDGETLLSKIALQKHLENKGHFLVGLKGDLDQIQEESLEGGSEEDETGGLRNVLRTLYIELIPKEENVADISDGRQSFSRTNSDDTTARSEGSSNFRRLRVLVYIHRPFIYCFLFEQRSSSLSYSKFYRDLHRNLLPIHKPLLSSTSVLKISQRIEEAHLEPDETCSIRSNGTNQLPNRGPSSDAFDVFDLLYDPRTLTLHTSIPNIPVPGTLAAEGIISGRKREAPSNWTRVDALNVHSQILNTLHSVQTRHTRKDLERTCKTTRGWWVVWLRIPPSATASRPTNPEEEEEEDDASTIRTDQIPRTPVFTSSRQEREEELYRTAILVRKAAESSNGSDSRDASSNQAGGFFSAAMFGLSALRAESTRTGGAQAGWGPPTLTTDGSLVGGIGFDARRYVEGLLSLNR